MSPKTASTLVLVTGGLLFTYAALDARSNSLPPEQTYKRMYSIFLAVVALGVAADLVPQLVGPFAILIIVAAWTKHKGALGGLVGSSAATGSRGQSPTTPGNTIGGAK